MTDGRLRALIVDDHDDIRRMLLRMLPAAGLEIAGQATSGETALEFLARESVDVVVMDIQMPGIGGVEATRQINKRWPAIKVFGFTRWGAADVSDMLEAGATAVFEKTRMAQLLNAVAGEKG